MHVDNMPFHAFSAKLRPLRFSVVEGLKNFTHAGTCTSPSVNLGSEVKFVGQIHFETAWKTRLSDIAPLRACSSDLWMQPSSPIVDERNLDVMQNEQNICQRESILLNLSQVMNGKSALKTRSSATYLTFVGVKFTATVPSSFLLSYVSPCILFVT